jgi:hypothetical protein
MTEGAVAWASLIWAEDGLLHHWSLPELIYIAVCFGDRNTRRGTAEQRIALTLILILPLPLLAYPL